jgi:hypothetical protein
VAFSKSGEVVVGGRGLIFGKARGVKEERGLEGRRGSYIRAGQSYLTGP